MSDRASNGYAVSWVTGIREDDNSDFQVRIQWKGFKQQSWVDLKHAMGARWSIERCVDRLKAAFKRIEDGEDDDDGSTSASSSPEPPAGPCTSKASQKASKAMKPKKLIQKKVPEVLLKKKSSNAPKSQ